MAGKGDKQRPREVDKKTFEDNWDRIFKKKKENPMWKKEKKEGLSSASISINPLLKMEVVYPFNFSASNSLRKKSTANDTRKIIVIQLFDKITLCNASIT